jgi:hypothetical protein
MTALTYDELKKLKTALQKHGALLHLHDACGGQSFEIEFDGKLPQEISDEVKSFFASRNMSVKYFSEDKKAFTIGNS